MISEGSCDTEDWSNEAEHQRCITEINSILKYIKIETNIEIAIRVLQYYIFFLFFLFE